MSNEQQHTSRDLRRIAILNRGEPAARFLRTLREYNLERGLQLEAVAVYTDPDEGAPFVLEADDVIHLGPAMTTDAQGRPVSSYCAHDQVVEALVAAGCDAVWPGWGFVSEDPRFVARLEDAGIVFIGPSSEAMLRLGDKIESKVLAERAGVPMGPWKRVSAEQTDAELRATADAVGYPLMVKASAGGGGRGIRRVDGPDGLVTAVRAVGDEVARVFGQGEVFVEACIEGGRHIEVQIVAGADGKAVALGVRDCSVQRRNQKIIEEAEAPTLPPEMRTLLCESAVRMVELAGYRGVATAEFLYQPERNAAAFLEVNSRLQVEHTITEVVTGLDLVAAQLDIARGLPWLDGPIPEPRGHAIEIRLNAEDPEQGFRPSPGTVRVLRPPAGPGVRVDSGIVEGQAIAPQFDSMIAKIITWGATRRTAIARMERALRELQVVVEDGATNQGFLLELLRHPGYLDATLDTAWLDKAVEAGEFGTPPWAFEALLVAAIIEYRLQRHGDVKRFFAQTQNGIPQQVPAPDGMDVQLRLRGQAHTISVYAQSRERYLVGPKGAQQSVVLESLGSHAALFEIGDRRHQVLFAWGRNGIHIEVDGSVHAVERASGGVVKAASPAMVVHVAVQEGDRVEVGQRLCTVEAMKLELLVNATEAGTVRSVLCRPNQSVTAGQSLFLIEPDSDADTSTDAARDLDLPEPSARPLDHLYAEQGSAPDPRRLDALDDDEARRVIDDLSNALRAMLVGYDVDPDLAMRLESLLSGCDFDNLDRPDRWAPLADLLGVFADVESLFDRNLLPLPEGAVAVSAERAFYDFCRRHHEGEDGVQPELVELLRSALEPLGVRSLDPSDDLREALWRLSVAHKHGELRHRLCSGLLRVVMGLDTAMPRCPRLRETLGRVAQVAASAWPFVADNAHQARYALFERPHYMQRRALLETMLDQTLAGPVADVQIVRDLARSPYGILPLLVARAEPGGHGWRAIHALVQRLYVTRKAAPLAAPETVTTDTGAELVLARFRVSNDGTAPGFDLLLGVAPTMDDVPALIEHMQATEHDCSVHEVVVRTPATAGPALSASRFALSTSPCLGEDACGSAAAQPPPQTGGDVREADRGGTLTWIDASTGLVRHAVAGVDGVVPHPEQARRMEADRLDAFELERLASPESILAWRGKARSNARDERIFVCAEVFDVPEHFDAGGGDELWELERAWFESLRIVRQAQAQRTRRKRLRGNAITLYVRKPVLADARALTSIALRLEAPSRGLGLERVVLRAPVWTGESGVGEPREVEFLLTTPGRHRLEVEARQPDTAPIQPMTAYQMAVQRARRLGAVYPYELARMLEGLGQGTAPHPDMERGRFVEYDLDETGVHLRPVERPHGQNEAAVVVGVVKNYTAKHPDGMERVWIASDATQAMGSLAEPECRRIIAALDLAERRQLPVEWLPISAGAKIAMDSGTENLDWTAAVLRRIVEFTQAGGEINLIVTGVNVGAQSYWNAEATMLMHTRGILIMTPDGSMVLTGKRALEYSGGVAAENEQGIGGFERIMGPNGQAQYLATDLGHAYAILFEHYRLTYRVPGERAVRAHETADPTERSILESPYAGDGFATVGEIFDDRTNPGRKTPFAIREVMSAVVDSDGGWLERFKSMRHGETAVVWDAHVGGEAVALIAVESRPIVRRGRIPMDGPDTWTGATLFPQSSKKIARAINAASGVRPVVVLANLSGFDGSPESLRKLQLECGAEIGRAVVNFDGPIVFVVIGRYHGGAYVVFSKALNPNLTALALEGSYASVIGGAPAAAVVMPREVRRRADLDPRVVSAKQALAGAAPVDKPRLRERLDTLLADVVLEKQGEVAREFDAVHSVQRAVEVGSLDAVIAAAELRPTIIERLRAARAAAAASSETVEAEDEASAALV